MAAAGSVSNRGLAYCALTKTAFQLRGLPWKSGASAPRKTNKMNKRALAPGVLDENVGPSAATHSAYCRETPLACPLPKIPTSNTPNV